MFINYLLRLYPQFLGVADWPNLALVNKHCNRLASIGAPSIGSQFRDEIFRCLQNQILVHSTDDDFRKRFLVRQKIDNLKFYQLASFADQYEDLKKFKFRYFSAPWAKIVKVPNDLYKVFHPGVILLSSSLTPGIFWKRIREYIEKKSFCLKPEWFHDIDFIEAKIWYFFHLIRGAPIFFITVDEGLFWAMKAFARQIRSFPDLFNFYMKGHWTDVRYALQKYERDPTSHFPVPCGIYPCKDLSCSLAQNWEWEPPTELIYYDRDDVESYLSKDFISLK